MKRYGIGFMGFGLALAVLLVMPALVEAATYYSIKPGDEVCTSILFGTNGGGEYTLVADYPDEGRVSWVDNHFTSLTAGPNNIVSVPVCFNAVDKRLSDEQNIKIVISTPRGNVTYEYGVCVAKYEDVDIVQGSATGSPCEVMGGHTDIFSASLTQPEVYATPGSMATYTLLLDASTPMTVGISKASGDVSVMSSETTVALGSGQTEVHLQVSSPSSPGDYRFSVLVAVSDCALSDCRKEVEGILHVASASETPQASFYVWLTPETKSVMGQQATEFVIKVQNYGDGQEITAAVATEAGLETDFSPYTTFLGKGESKDIIFNVRPATAERKSYKISATVEGKDGTKRSAKSWLTVDEMVADASKLGQDGFINRYDADGGATLEEWEELKSVSGGVVYDDGGFVYDDESSAPNYTLYIVIAVVAVVAAVLILFLYKKSSAQGGSGSPSWEDLGLK